MTFIISFISFLSPPFLYPHLLLPFYLSCPLFSSIPPLTALSSSASLWGGLMWAPDVGVDWLETERAEGFPIPPSLLLPTSLCYLIFLCFVGSFWLLWLHSCFLLPLFKTTSVYEDMNMFKYHALFVFLYELKRIIITLPYTTLQQNTNDITVMAFLWKDIMLHTVFVYLSLFNISCLYINPLICQNIHKSLSLFNCFHYLLHNLTLYSIF